MDTNTTSEVVSSAFGLFSELPIELRLKIWTHALPRRIVPITYDTDQDRYHSFDFTSPAIFFVNREAREVALNNIKLSFGTERSKPSIYFDSTRDTLFLDDWLGCSRMPYRARNLYTGDREWIATGSMRLHDAEKVERLAFSSECFHPWSYPNNQNGGAGVPPRIGFNTDNRYAPHTFFRSLIFQLMKRFQNLKELILVIDCAGPYSRGPVQFVDIERQYDCARQGVRSVCWIKRHIEPLASHLKSHSHEVFTLDNRKKPFQRPPGNPQAVPIKMPGIKLVAAYKRDDPSDLDCFRAPIELTNLLIEEQTDDEDNNDFEENVDDAAELEDELRDIKKDEEQYKELVGSGEYADFQGLYVGEDYLKKRLEL
jgi:hypothetical protein